MRVAEGAVHGQAATHGLGDARIDRRGRQVVEIDGVRSRMVPSALYIGQALLRFRQDTAQDVQFHLVEAQAAVQASQAGMSCRGAAGLRKPICTSVSSRCT
jgi:hypothetical protein